MEDFSPDDLDILRRIQKALTENSKSKGFRDPPEGITPEQWDSPPMQVVRAAIFTANQHGETSEFWEAARKGALHEPCDKSQKMIDMGLPALTNAEEEVADEIIRALDKAEYFNVDPAKAVAIKMAFNRGRPFRHGNKLL